MPDADDRHRYEREVPKIVNHGGKLNEKVHQETDCCA